MKGKFGELNRIKDKINAWQNNDFVHPLTCGNNSFHDDLIPKLENEGGTYELFLVCKECEWKQDIPTFLSKIKIQYNL